MCLQLPDFKMSYNRNVRCYWQGFLNRFNDVLVHEKFANFNKPACVRSQDCNTSRTSTKHVQFVTNLLNVSTDCYLKLADTGEDTGVKGLTHSSRDSMPLQP